MFYYEKYNGDRYPSNNGNFVISETDSIFYASIYSITNTYGIAKEDIIDILQNTYNALIPTRLSIFFINEEDAKNACDFINSLDTYSALTNSDSNNA